MSVGLKGTPAFRSRPLILTLVLRVKGTRDYFSGREAGAFIKLSDCSACCQRLWKLKLELRVRRELQVIVPW